MAGRKTRTSWKDEVSRVLKMGHPVGGDLVVASGRSVRLIGRECGIGRTKKLGIVDQ